MSSTSSESSYESGHSTTKKDLYEKGIIFFIVVFVLFSGVVIFGIVLFSKIKTDSCSIESCDVVFTPRTSSSVNDKESPNDKESCFSSYLNITLDKINIQYLIISYVTEEKAQNECTKYTKEKIKTCFYEEDNMLSTLTFNRKIYLGSGILIASGSFFMLAGMLGITYYSVEYNKNKRMIRLE